VKLEHNSVRVPVISVAPHKHRLLFSLRIFTTYLVGHVYLFKNNQFTRY
jgi:hypothetical protein